MTDSPKYTGVGAHGTMPPLNTGKSRDEMIAEFKAKRKEPRDEVRYLLGENPKPKEAAELRRYLRRQAQQQQERDKRAGIKPVGDPQYPQDYPWLKPGWRG